MGGGRLLIVIVLVGVVALCSVGVVFWYWATELLDAPGAPPAGEVGPRMDRACPVLRKWDGPERVPGAAIRIRKS